MLKKFFTAAVIVLLISFSISPALAETENSAPVLKGNPSIILNGAILEMNGLVMESQLFLPLRSISEFIGYRVSWYPENRTVGIAGVNKQISLQLKNQTAIVNGHEYYLQYTPPIMEGRTYMSTDFYEENLGLKIDWNKEAGVATLSSIHENPISVKTVQLNAETKALKTTVKYPVISGLADASVQLELNAIFKQHADEALKEGARNAEALAPAVIEFPDMPGQCETYVDYRIKYNQNNILSILLINYQYAGGAHGGTVQTGVTVDLTTGRQFALKNLFEPNADYAPALDGFVKAQLEERDLTSALLKPFMGVSDDQKYFLSNSGIVLYFGQYEILPYAGGMPEFTVEFTQISDILSLKKLLNP